MNQSADNNPYAVSDYGAGTPTPRKQLTIQEKADFLKSAKQRLKANESKTAIYQDYKDTEIETTIRSILSSTPSLHYRKSNAWLNSLLLVMFISVCLCEMLLLFNSGELKLRYSVIWLLQILTVYQIATYFRFGYWSAIHLVVLISIVRIRYYATAPEAPDDWGLITATCVLGLASIALALVLLVRLFPFNRPFMQHKLTPFGEPIFDS